MITLALAQMVYFAALRAPFTHGEDGLQGVPRGQLFGPDLASELAMTYLVLAIAAAGFALIVRIVHSPFGQVLEAIKENAPRAVSPGFEVDRYKLLAFALSAGLVVLMTLVGGMGTMAGPILGAWLTQQSGVAWFGALGESVGMVTGLIFIVCVLLFRRGIVGELGALLERGRRAGA